MSDIEESCPPSDEDVLSSLPESLSDVRSRGHGLGSVLEVKKAYSLSTMNP